MISAVSLADLLDPRRASEIITGRVATEALEGATGLLVRCAMRLRDQGVDETTPVRAWFVPGRIEVLGKHTDYAGGRSLLAAVDRGIYMVAAARTDRLVTVADARTGENTTLPIGAELLPPASWAAYPAAVVRRLARNFPGSVSGASLAFASTLPAAAGMSSSSALIIATFLALSGVSGLPATDVYRAHFRTAEDLAEYLAAVESGADYADLSGGLGVGTQGGSQDHTAILCARPGQLVQYAFRPVRFERSLPCPAGCIFVIAASGVTAEKTGAARERYNAAARVMGRIVQMWRETTNRSDGSVGEALAADSAAVDRIREILRGSRHGHAPAAADARRATKSETMAESPVDEAGGESLLHRFEQFVEESQVIVPAAGDALATGDLERFGRLVDRSQELAERALRNQAPETVELARLARELGAVAATAFGAGFGGSTWALVPESESDAYLARWRERYLEQFPQHEAAAIFFPTHPGPPAQQLT